MEDFNLETLDFSDLLRVDGLLDSGNLLQLPLSQLTLGALDNALYDCRDDMDSILNRFSLQLDDCNVHEVQSAQAQQQQHDISTSNGNMGSLEMTTTPVETEALALNLDQTADENLTVPGVKDATGALEEANVSGAVRCDQESYEGKCQVANQQKAQEKKCGICGRFFRNNMHLYLHTLTFHPNVEVDFECFESEAFTTSNTGQRKSTKRSSQSQRRGPAKIRKLDQDRADKVSEMKIAEADDTTTPTNSSACELLHGALENLALERQTQDAELLPSKPDDSVDEGVDLPETISILGKRKHDIQSTEAATKTSGRSELAFDDVKLVCQNNENYGPATRSKMGRFISE